MLLCVYLKMGHFSPARITTGISTGGQAAVGLRREEGMLLLVLLWLNYHWSWNHTYPDAGFKLAGWKLFTGINKEKMMMMMIASLTHIVEGMEISQLWVVVWGQQRLFPCVTFITGVRLHPVCIRLLWHWILIPMEKDYVIFAGAEIDYPFWASWKVASLSADAVREQRAGRTVPEKPSMDSTSDLNFFFFHFSFVLPVVWTCCFWRLTASSRSSDMNRSGAGFEKSAC